MKGLWSHARDRLLERYLHEYLPGRRRKSCSGCLGSVSSCQEVPVGGGSEMESSIDKRSACETNLSIMRHLSNQKASSVPNERDLHLGTRREGWSNVRTMLSMIHGQWPCIYLDHRVSPVSPGNSDPPLMMELASHDERFFFPQRTVLQLFSIR